MAKTNTMKVEVTREPKDIFKIHFIDLEGEEEVVIHLPRGLLLALSDEINTMFEDERLEDYLFEDERLEDHLSE